MELIYENPWSISILILFIAVIFIWNGLFEGLLNRLFFGIIFLFLSVLIWFLGVFIDTPREHAKRIVKDFVYAVEQGRTKDALGYVSKNLILIDDWEGSKNGDRSELSNALNRLHNQYNLSNSTILQLDLNKREGDVMVDLSLFVRVSGIGSVPSKWRIIVGQELTDGNTRSNASWLIWSIDAIEIAGRKF